MTFVIVLIWVSIAWIALLHIWHRRSIKALEKQHKEDWEIWDEWHYRLQRLEKISDKFHPNPGIVPPPPPIDPLKMKGI